MSRVVMIKCEMCPEHFIIPDMFSKPYEYETPEGWIMLAEGNPQHVEAQHFCSKTCLVKWAGVVLRNDMPQTKMRRFLLVDGETADIIEGIKWSNGFVGIDPGSDHIHDHCKVDYYRSWDDFKKAHDGSGIQWIDQEVSDAT